jgi:GSH-dependent disulfide-bond oxidoreductase
MARVQSKSKASVKSSPKSARQPAKSSKSKIKSAAKTIKSRIEQAIRGRAAKPKKPIDLYYWPTPNGWKISIMLEECRLAYNVVPVNISKGEQFTPEFLAISPNNRMPAIVDHDGPGGKPISVFESGAILQYLGRKTGKFYPADERARVAVDEWLFWQMGGLGPMSGQNNHFRHYCPEQIPYAINRYGDEVNRLYGVMNIRLKDRDFLAGKYSIADMACVGWVNGYERQGQDISDFPNLKRWLETLKERPAVARGLAVGKELRQQPTNMMDPAVRSVLFNQRARTA